MMSCPGSGLTLRTAHMVQKCCMWSLNTEGKVTFLKIPSHVWTVRYDLKTLCVDADLLNEMFLKILIYVGATHAAKQMRRLLGWFIQYSLCIAGFLSSVFILLWLFYSSKVCSSAF